MVRNAPVKGQCAKDYLYGEDLKLERLLQIVEGKYARILRTLQFGAEKPTKDDLSTLREFAYLQYSRTDMAMRRMRQMREGMRDAMYEGRPVKAANNIYFSQWEDRDRIKREFLEVSGQRPQSWCNFSVFVPDGITERGEHYRRATDAERKTAREAMIAMSTIHPAPSKWISKLRYRRPIRTCFNGSAAGHVRKATWLKRGIRRNLSDVID